jgi:hypothetical protein
MKCSPPPPYVRRPMPPIVFPNPPSPVTGIPSSPPSPNPSPPPSAFTPPPAGPQGNLPESFREIGLIEGASPPPPPEPVGVFPASQQVAVFPVGEPTGLAGSQIGPPATSIQLEAAGYTQLRMPPFSAYVGGGGKEWGSRGTETFSARTDSCLPTSTYVFMASRAQYQTFLSFLIFHLVRATAPFCDGGCGNDRERYERTGRQRDIELHYWTHASVSNQKLTKSRAENQSQNTLNRLPGCGQPWFLISFGPQQSGAGRVFISRTIARTMGERPFVPSGHLVVHCDTLGKLLPPLFHEPFCFRMALLYKT